MSTTENDGTDTGSAWTAGGLSRRRVLGLMAGAAVAPAFFSADAAALAPRGAAPKPAARRAAGASTGTIRLGAYEAGVILTWNPWSNAGQDFFWNWFTQRLLTVAPDGSVHYDLAESYEVSDDGLTYTFHLVPEAMWHDGTPVTAADVAFTFNTSLKADAGSTLLSVGDAFVGAQAVLDDNSQDCEGIVVVDDHTIAFTIEQPNAQVLATVFPALRISPAHVFEGVALTDYATQPTNTALAVGSGPYRMTEFVDKQFIRLEAFDDFASAAHVGPPAAEEVIITIYPDPNAQLLSNEAREVDFTYYRSPSADQVDRLETITGYRTLPSKVGYSIFYSTNLVSTNAPLLQDKRVRQAMLWGLDRDTLVNDVLGGVSGIPPYATCWIAEWANAEGLTAYHPQDTELAASLLAEAGWDPNVVLDVRHNPPRLSDDIPVILAMWEALGIKSKLTPTPDDTFIRDFYEDKGDQDPSNGDDGPNYDIFFTYGFGTLDGSPWGADSTLGSDRVYPEGSNSMRYANEEWDSEFAAALLATTQEEQAVHFKRCTEIFNDELPYAPMYQRVDYSSASERLTGPELVENSHPSAGGIPYWDWAVTE